MWFYSSMSDLFSNKELQCKYQIFFKNNLRAIVNADGYLKMN